MCEWTVAHTSRASPGDNTYLPHCHCGRTYLKQCCHGNGSIYLPVSYTITMDTPTPYTIAMGTPSSTFCCYGNTQLYILLLWEHPALHSVAMDTPTFPTWSCMPPRPIILSVWRAHSSPSLAWALLGLWAWQWSSRFKMATVRQEAGGKEGQRY